MPTFAERLQSEIDSMKADAFQVSCIKACNAMQALIHNIGQTTCCSMKLHCEDMTDEQLSQLKYENRLGNTALICAKIYINRGTIEADNLNLKISASHCDKEIAYHIWYGGNRVTGCQNLMSYEDIEDMSDELIKMLAKTIIKLEGK